MSRILSLLLFLQALAFTAHAQPIPARIIIEWDETARPEILLETWNRSRVSSSNLILEKHLSPALHIDLLQAGPLPADPEAMLEIIRQTPGVAAAQWDYPLEFRNTPNDPEYQTQWSFPHVGADLAWNHTTGGLTASGDTIVVAILDGGFDTGHPDLKPNIWINRGEIPGDGLDNDQNGFADDVNGWNFADDQPGHPLDLHGTSVIGIIGAAGNNGQGVSGINWSVKMMLFTTLHVSDVIEAYSYILDQRQLFRQSNGEKGALVVATNASFGVEGVFCNQQPVWGAMYDRLGYAGILTAAATSNLPVNVDETGDMPSTCTSPFLVAVLETDHHDEKDPDSAFGPLSIELGAPGSSIRTTEPNGKYGYFHGTSAAAPHVCGAIALLFSTPCKTFAEGTVSAPQQAALAVRQALMDGAEHLPALEGLTQSSGRLSIGRSIELLSAQCQAGNQSPLKILNVFPNPAGQGIEIEYQANSATQYLLTNTLGQTVLDGELPDSPWPEKHFYLPLGSLPKGVYLLSLSDGEYLVSRAFFVN